MDDRLDGVIIARGWLSRTPQKLSCSSIRSVGQTVLAWHPFPTVVRVAADGTVVWRSER
jgi:hypothetical protein